MKDLNEVQRAIAIVDGCQITKLTGRFTDTITVEFYDSGKKHHGKFCVRLSANNAKDPVHILVLGSQIFEDLPVRCVCDFYIDGFPLFTNVLVKKDDYKFLSERYESWDNRTETYRLENYRKAHISKLWNEYNF